MTPLVAVMLLLLLPCTEVRVLLRTRYRTAVQQSPVCTRYQVQQYTSRTWYDSIIEAECNLGDAGPIGTQRRITAALTTNSSDPNVVLLGGPLRAPSFCSPTLASPRGKRAWIGPAAQVRVHTLGGRGLTL